MEGAAILEGWYDFLTVEELCEVLKSGRNAAYTLLNSGELKIFRNGRVWRAPKQAVIEYVGDDKPLSAMPHSGVV